MQPGSSVGTRPADRFLPALSGLLPDHHLHPGDAGHGAARVGLHCAVLPVQVSVETDGEGHGPDL